jgi:hypothetical protein
MTERRVFFAMAVFGVVLSAREALAEGNVQGNEKALTDAIDVHPGATCVELGPLAQDVETWLGADTVDADVWVRVEGSTDDPRTVSFEMGRGDRVLARRRFAPGPERCEHLEAALGLAIALAIRVSLLDEIVGPRQEPPPARPPVEARRPWAVGVVPAVSLGVLPGAALGAGVSAERYLPPNFALRLGALGLATRDRTFATGPGAFDAEILALRLDACVRFEFVPRLSGVGCAGILAGELLAQGHDFASSRSASSAWVAAASAFGLALGLSDRWSLSAEASLVAPLAHTQVEVLSAAGTVAETRDLSSAGVTLTLGPLYRF